MQNATYICRVCGGIRRRGVVYDRRRDGVPGWPRCDARPMERLTHVQAAGAAPLRRVERLVWLARGKRLVRRPGNRWRAVLTPGDARRADAQLAAYRSASASSRGRCSRESVMQKGGRPDRAYPSRHLRRAPRPRA